MRLLTAALIVFLLWPVPAAAQGQPQPESCAPLPFANLANIQSRYGEVNTGMGLSSNGWMVQRWVNLETDTWTITMRSPRGTVCLLAAGEGWRPVERRPVAPRT